jgi:LPXTG-motif cell wall-anchored protein
MGKWKLDDDSYETILKFENCDDRNGFFKLETTEEDGSVYVTEGIVKLQYCYDVAGFRQYLYVLYLADKNGDYNQIYMTISAFGETPLKTLYLSNADYSFSRVTQKYSYEKLAEMAKKDYEQKTGILPADTKIIENAGGTVTIVLLDENGNDLDAYTVDPDTGIGERFSDESEVNLPQTGMSGIHKALTGLAALMGITGMALIKKSRKENEE